MAHRYHISALVSSDRLHCASSKRCTRTGAPRAQCCWLRSSLPDHCLSRPPQASPACACLASNHPSHSFIPHFTSPFPPRFSTISLTTSRSPSSFRQLTHHRSRLWPCIMLGLRSRCPSECRAVKKRTCGAARDESGGKRARSLRIRVRRRRLCGAWVRLRTDSQYTSTASEPLQ